MDRTAPDVTVAIIGTGASADPRLRAALTPSYRMFDPASFRRG